MTFRALPSRAECVSRLNEIFPRSAFDVTLSGPLAGVAVAAMLYVDAVIDDDRDPVDTDVWVRPSTCLWLSDAVYARADDASRAAWRAAALKQKKHVVALLEGWGMPHEQWYADNTRETLRDEIFPAWVQYGAGRARAGLPTSSSKPRWALTASFADLFDPELTGTDLLAAIDRWREIRMSPGARARAHVAHERRTQGHAVDVTLPNGVVRHLEPGLASRILKGVVESWAPRRLVDPTVLTISEPGDKVYMADAKFLQRLGVTLNISTLLPDALVIDVGTEPAEFWMVEAVATDGPIHEVRKRELLAWATDQRIPAADCRFLTAFESRNAGPAKRRLKDLAAGTYAWFLDEPMHELAWDEIPDQGDPLGAPSP